MAIGAPLEVSQLNRIEIVKWLVATAACGFPMLFVIGSDGGGACIPGGTVGILVWAVLMIAIVRLLRRQRLQDAGAHLFIGAAAFVVAQTVIALLARDVVAIIFVYYPVVVLYEWCREPDLTHFWVSLLFTVVCGAEAFLIVWFLGFTLGAIVRVLRAVPQRFSRRSGR